MKILFSIVFFLAILWTALVCFANMMRPTETGEFVGGSTLAFVWLIVAVIGAAAWIG